MITMQFKICQETKVRNRVAGEKGKKAAFLDEAGKRWHGLTCPTCNATEHASNRQVFQSLKTRICRDCGVKTANYYRCVACWGYHKFSNPVDTETAYYMDAWGVTV